MLTRSIAFRIFMALFLFIGLSPGCNQTAYLVASEIGSDIEPGQEPDKVLLVPSDTTGDLYDGLKNPSSVRKYYEFARNEPAWIRGKSLSPLGDSMFLMLKKSRHYGLLPVNYHVDSLKVLIGSVDPETNLLRTEVLLTDAYFSFSHDLRYGRSESNSRNNDDSVRIQILSHIVTEGGLEEKLESLEPTYHGYRLMKNALRVMIDSLPQDYRNMILEGRINLEEPFYKRLQTMEVNLQRWRMDVGIMEDKYILINIPAFTLYLFSEDSLLMESRVIVGKPLTPTPSLTSAIERMVLFPFWHVPRKIAVEEYLPAIKKDVSVIKRNQFDVLDSNGRKLHPDSIDWQRFNRNYFPISLRQREGSSNALGIIKFDFDNPFAVFVHDTNNKKLFQKDERALSHGCIRMEKALELAHYLMTGDIARRSDLLESYLKEKRQRTIEFKNPLPIYVRYFTCEVKGGDVIFYRDVYSRDQAVMELLY